jgi:deoxycytidylate deaminase
MQIIHELLIHTPEYLALGLRSYHSHVYGRVNVPADAASRNRGDIIGRVTNQLGIAAKRLPLPERALTFLHAAIAAIVAAALKNERTATKTLTLLITTLPTQTRIETITRTTTKTLTTKRKYSTVPRRSANL